MSGPLGRSAQALCLMRLRVATWRGKVGRTCTGVCATEGCFNDIHHALNLLRRYTDLAPFQPTGLRAFQVLPIDDATVVSDRMSLLENAPKVSGLVSRDVGEQDMPGELLEEGGCEFDVLVLIPYLAGKDAVDFIR
jgi:hypothetical protein